MTSSIPRAGEPIKFVPKGWGFEWIVNCENIVDLFIAKDRSVLHYSKKDSILRSSGKIRISYGWTDDMTSTTKILERENEFRSIGMRHQMYGLEDTELFGLVQNTLILIAFESLLGILIVSHISL